MKKFISTAFVAAFALSLAGCSEGPTDVVTGADKTEIEKYQEAEAAEQAALSGEMAQGLNVDKAPKK